MVDKLMATILGEIGVNQDQFLAACRTAKNNPNHWKIVKQILLVEDFNKFAEIMVKRNKDMQDKALKFLVKQDEKKLQRFYNQQTKGRQDSGSDEYDSEDDPEMKAALKAS